MFLEIWYLSNMQESAKEHTLSFPRFANILHKILPERTEVAGTTTKTRPIMTNAPPNGTT